MLGFFEKKKGDQIDHWYSLVPGFNTSAKEFYATIEKELKDRQVPGLEMFRVEYSEGGIMSSNREYLRMTRERLVFDICAAPFGTAYFFSCRFAEIPSVIKLWQLLLVVIGVFMLIALALNYLGFILGSIVLLAGFVFLIYTLRNAVALGLKDFDAMLIKSPLVGPIYENWFRKDTLYRQDTRILYHDTVDAVVKAKVEEVTGAKGIKLIQFNQSALFAELYKTTIVPLPREAP
jgi:uncharacterized membrane protein YbaN (DUF454 family)